MKIDFDFKNLSDLLNLISIESKVETGPKKLDSVRYALKKLQLIDKLIDSGWEVSTLEDNYAYHFTLRVGTYINHHKRLIVIALSGTKNTHDIKPDLEILSGRIPTRFQKFSDYLNKYLNDYVIQTYRKMDYKIILTGHSLGGFLAQLGYVKFKVEHPDFKGIVLAFDSPGVKTHALKLLTDKFLSNNNSHKAKVLARQTLESSTFSNSIMNIIRKFNIININGKQLGTYILISEDHIHSKSEQINHFKLWKNLSFHKLNAFIKPAQNFENYYIYQLNKPILTEARLLHPPRYDTQSILLNIKKLQQQKLPQRIFYSYIENLIQKISLPRLDIKLDYKLILHELNHVISQSSQFMKPHGVFSRISKLFKKPQNNVKFEQQLQNNILMLNNLMQNSHTDSIILPLHSDSTKSVIYSTKSTENSML